VRPDLRWSSGPYGKPVSLSAPTTVTITCSHQDTNGATPYINSNADLWAHRSSNLVITQLP